MGLFWILIIFLVANAVFTDFLVNFPLQLFGWLAAGWNIFFLALVIALVSWFIGQD